MIPFRQYFRSQLKSKKAPWLEMARGHSLSKWDIPITPEIKNILSIIPGGYSSQSQVLEWIFNKGLFLASKARQALAQAVRQDLGREDIHDAQMFSPKAHKDHPEIAKAVRKNIGVWEENKPKEIQINSKDGVIKLNLDRMNDWLMESGREPFEYGGFDPSGRPIGFIEYLEKSDFGNHITSFDPEDHQGSDLSEPDDPIDPETRKQFYTFHGAQNPKDYKRYQMQVRKMLRATQGDESGLKGWGSKMGSTKLKSRVADVYGYNARAQQWLPPGDQGWDLKTYEKLMNYIQDALWGKTPEGERWNPSMPVEDRISAFEVKGQPYTPEEIEEILGKITGGEKRGNPGQIANVFIAPGLKTKRYVSQLINKGAEMEGKGERGDIDQRYPQGEEAIPYGEFATIAPWKFDAQDKDLVVYKGQIDDMVKNEGWEFEVGKGKNSNRGFLKRGPEMIPVMKIGGGKGDQELWVKGVPDKNNIEPYDSPSGVISAKDVGMIKSNYQGKRQRYPATPEVQQATVDGLLSDPSKFGENPGPHGGGYSDLSELQSVKKAVATAINLAVTKGYPRETIEGEFGGIKGSAAENLRGWAVEGLYHFMGHNDFYWGNMNRPTKIDKDLLGEMDDAPFDGNEPIVHALLRQRGYDQNEIKHIASKMKSIRNSSKVPQSANSSDETTYIEPEAMDAFLQAGMIERRTKMAYHVFTRIVNQIKDKGQSMTGDDGEEATAYTPSTDDSEAAQRHHAKAVRGRTKIDYETNKPIIRKVSGKDLSSSSNDTVYKQRVLSLEPNDVPEYNNYYGQMAGSHMAWDEKDDKDLVYHSGMLDDKFSNIQFGDSESDEGEFRQAGDGDGRSGDFGQVSHLINRIIGGFKELIDSEKDIQVLGQVDGIHDWMAQLTKSYIAQPEIADKEKAGQLLNLMKSVKGDLENAETWVADEDLVSQTLAGHIENLAGSMGQFADVRTKTTPPQQTQQQQPRQPAAAQPIWQPGEMPNMTSFTSRAHDILGSYDDDQIAQLQQWSQQNDPRYLAQLQKLMQQRGLDTAHHDPMKLGMMSFSEWRTIRETDAVYDGTPAKDGGGFNWWGAIGKPGGVSISGEADTAEEDPTGSKGTKKRKKKNGSKTTKSTKSADSTESGDS